MFKYEMHMHAKPCSKCGGATIREMVDGLVDHGYAGAFLTDHFYRGNSGIDRALPWEEFAGAYVDEWREGAAYAKERGIDLFFGLEEGYAAGKEVLLYGLTPEVVLATPEMPAMSLPELSAFVHENGGLIYYAHPFRARAYIPDPDTVPDTTLVDGIEVYNFGSTPERNEIGEALAIERNLFCISGGDAHTPGWLGNAGVVFDERPADSAAFVSLLKSGKYKIIVAGEISDKYERGKHL